MELALKQRLLGVAILVSLAILIIPMLLDTQRPDLVEPLQIEEPTELQFTRQPLPPNDLRLSPEPEIPTFEPQSLATGEQWFIQVGRFKNIDFARRLGNTLQQAGYPIELREQTVSGDLHQRVWVGPYDAQSEAEQVLAGIRAKKALTDAHEGWIVKQP